jgi:hypothetical protein
VRKGYNCESGGRAGKRLSEETKKKLSIAHTGKVLSEEHRRHIGDISRGKPRTEIAKRNISDALKGRHSAPLTSEQMDKLQQYYARSRQPIEVFPSDGKLLETINRVNVTTKKYNLCPKTLLKALNSKTGTIPRGRCKGMTFRRIASDTARVTSEETRQKMKKSMRVAYYK